MCVCVLSACVCVISCDLLISHHMSDLILVCHLNPCHVLPLPMSHLIRAERENLRGKASSGLGNAWGLVKKGGRRRWWWGRRNKAGGAGGENHNGVAFRAHEWRRRFAERDKWSERKMRGQCVRCSVIWRESPRLVPSGVEL